MKRTNATLGALVAVALLAPGGTAGADWTAYQGGALNVTDHTSGRPAPLSTAWKVAGNAHTIGMAARHGR